MYTTRPLSVYKNAPETISYPPEGPNSSYLVIQDEESTVTCCFGLCVNPAIHDLPFPQNKRLSIEYHQNGENSSYHTYDEVYLIPVINMPLSSNRYYAIKADGRRKGEAYASSREQDKGICCFCIPCIRDVKPQTFNPEDIYQQFEFSATETCMGNRLSAKAVAPDGHPPRFLRRRGWSMNAKTPKNLTLGDAPGLDHALRAHLPDFGFSVTQERSNSATVGKWYCPFIFIKQGTEKDQIKNSVFYEMTLEQRWERVFAVDNTSAQEKVVSVDALVPTEVVRTARGLEGQRIEGHDPAGVVWFRPLDDGRGLDEHVGLSKLIVERMMWEQERVGWVKGKERQVRVVKDERYEGVIGWRSFGLYVLVESFVLKKNDGSVVLTYEFWHTQHLRSKWE